MSTPVRSGLTMALATWVSVQETSLPADVEHQARRLLLDYLCAAIVGSQTPAARAVLDVASENYGTGDAIVIGCGARLSAAGAALVNGTAAHGFELDDGYTPGSSHPSSPVVSAALALGQSMCAGSGRVLRAIAIGVEVAARIAAAGHPSTWRRGFHNTPLAGVFGAAAACAVLRELSAEETASAFGVAGSHAGGLFAFLGSGAEVKRLHAGKAARDGLLSVEMARRGLTGPPEVFDSNPGYFTAFAGDAWNSDLLVDGLGEDWAALRTYVKPYPCCRHLHGPIDCMLAALETDQLEVPAIESIEVMTYEVASHHAASEVSTVLDAQMSIPYAVAVTLLRGSPGLREFTPAAWQDPRVRDLTGRVAVRSDEALTARYPAERPAEVLIRQRGGPAMRFAVAQPLGEPSNPMTDAQLGAKFTTLTSGILRPAGVDPDAVVDCALGAGAVDDVLGLLRGCERARAGS
jgi:2-methylcitrate dehydratase PrpD